MNGKRSSLRTAGIVFSQAVAPVRLLGFFMVHISVQGAGFTTRHNSTPLIHPDTLLPTNCIQDLAAIEQVKAAQLPSYTLHDCLPLILWSPWIEARVRLPH